MAKDTETKISEIKEKAKKFCEDRDWDQFHNPKDLAIALAVEAAEVLEHFKFKSAQEMESLFKDPIKREDIEDELADVVFNLARLSQKYDIDLSQAFERKMLKNQKKYPIDKSKGSNKKYTELR